MEEIELGEIFWILRKKAWLIVLITVLSIVTSGLISYFVLVPEYETFTTLMLGKPKDYTEDTMQYQDVLLNQKLVTTYGEIAKSRIVSNEIIDNLELDLTPEELKNKVKVSLVNNTEIIKITVSDTSPELAAKMANEAADVFMKHIKKIMNIENVQVIDIAEVPTNSVKPRPKLNMAIAGVLGMMISVFLIFMLEYMDNTIKTPEDVARHLDLPVIGMIPKIKE